MNIILTSNKSSSSFASYRGAAEVPASFVSLDEQALSLVVPALRVEDSADF